MSPVAKAGHLVVKEPAQRRGKAEDQRISTDPRTRASRLDRLTGQRVGSKEVGYQLSDLFELLLESTVGMTPRRQTVFPFPPRLDVSKDQFGGLVDRNPVADDS